MDIIVVDDEPLARQRLINMLSDSDEFNVVAEAGNAEQALSLIDDKDPDLVLLDIQMPGESGLQAAAKIGALDDPPAVIFCTAHDQHALQAFGVNATDYLLKPVRKSQLLSALTKARQLNRVQRHSIESAPNGRDHITARTHAGLELIALSDVFFFLADQKYVTVYHQDGETLIDESLKALEEEFSDRFVRIHRNALVATQRITGLIKNAEGQCELSLHGTDHKPQVSRRHLAGIRDLLNSL